MMDPLFPVMYISAAQIVDIILLKNYDIMSDIYADLLHLLSNHYHTMSPQLLSTSLNNAVLLDVSLFHDSRNNCANVCSYTASTYKLFCIATGIKEQCIE